MQTEKDILLSLDCEENTITYLGDGVYAGFDGYQIWLVCRRENDFHHIALDPRTYVNLGYFVNQIYNNQSSELGEHQVVLDAIKEC